MNRSRESDFEECLAGFVMGDLEEEEFRDLLDLSESDGGRRLNDLERIASTVLLASIDRTEAMPESVRLAIAARGRPIVALATAKLQAPVSLPTTTRAFRLREAVAWTACIAASLLAIMLWQRVIIDSDRTMPAPMSRDSLVANAPDLIRAQWTKGTTPLKNEVAGDVVWSNSVQRGFMRFVGMPVNDPKIWQYQLWIIDPSRDDEPIDGGVFDITTTEESIVAIQSKLTVNQPLAFAVTIEKPGGVVVSKQELLPLFAFVPSEKQEEKAVRIL